MDKRYEAAIEGMQTMAEDKTGLMERIESGKQVLVAEISPPSSGDPALVVKVAREYAGKVHALGVDDNRNGVCMSALVAASLVASEGVEPILHVVTRDRNRVALVSDYLGAQALGIRNLLCTSGTHQTLCQAKASKNVFDVDCVQLLQTLTNLPNDGQIVGAAGIDGLGPACLGAAASPYADPIELQLIRLSKKVTAGAKFLITQPVFDLERFEAWFKAVTDRGTQEKVAILAGVRVLTDAGQTKEFARKRPDPMVPDAVLQRIASKPDKDSQRAAGVEIAVETIQRLSRLGGLRGFQVCGHGDDAAALEVIEKSGLEIE